MNDPVLRPALEAFFREGQQTFMDQLLSATKKRKSVSDTWRESYLSGAASAYESAFAELEAFAKRELEQASQ